MPDVVGCRTKHSHEPRMHNVAFDAGGKTGREFNAEEMSRALA